MDMRQNEPYSSSHEQYSWTPYPQTFNWFDQWTYPGQDYYNMGYDPTIPIMPQQNYPEYFTGLDNGAYYPYQDGYDQYGYYGGGWASSWDIQHFACQYQQSSVVEDSQTTASQPKDYIDCNNRNYYQNAGCYTMDEYNGGPMRNSTYYHDNRYQGFQPYTLPGQQYSNRYAAREKRQENETQTEISKLLAESERLRASIQREIENQQIQEALVNDKQSVVYQTSSNEKSYNSGVQTATSYTITTKKDGGYKKEKNDGDLPKEFKAISLDGIMKADEHTANQMLEDIERRIEFICANEPQDTDTSFTNQVKKALGSEEFAELWDIAREGALLAQTGKATVKTIGLKDEGYNKTLANKERQAIADLIDVVNIEDIEARSTADYTHQSTEPKSDREEVLRVKGLGSVFSELRGPGNDVIVDPQTLEARTTKGRKRCINDNSQQSAKRCKLSAGAWF